MTTTAPSTTTFTYFFMTDHRGQNHSTTTLWSPEPPTLTAKVKSVRWS